MLKEEGEIAPINFFAVQQSRVKLQHMSTVSRKVYLYCD